MLFFVEFQSFISRIKLFFGHYKSKLHVLFDELLKILHLRVNASVFEI